jgi:hypothetical protein
MLLMAAVMAQAVGATAWLPVIRRGLAGIGVGRRDGGTRGRLRD